MEKVINFLSYHNAVPLALVVLALGAGSVFAATETGILPLSGTAAAQPVDASVLIAINAGTFDINPVVTGVTETADSYTVSYSLKTLAPQGGAWAPYTKTGEFTIAKNALPGTGLQGYVIAKLQDIETGERDYLTRAQAAEQALAQKQNEQPASAFASLVGLALGQIPMPQAPVHESAPVQATEPLPQTPPQNTIPQLAQKTVATSSDTATGKDAVSTTTATTTAVVVATSTPRIATSTTATVISNAATSTATTTQTAAPPDAQSGQNQTGQASTTPSAIATTTTTTTSVTSTANKSTAATPAATSTSQ